MNPVRILGLDFFQGSVAESVQAALAGGLVVAPSGPGLATLTSDLAYRDALLAADVRLLDSGLLALLYESRHHRKLTRISGLYFLEEFLQSREIRAANATLWVAPTAESAQRTRQWLAQAHGVETPPECWHIAPRYDPARVQDEALRALIQKQKPRYIFIGVGGGPQEKLGAWLKARLEYRPTILCTGAAIAFLTGEQARIPAWADRARLGWLARCLQDPMRFVPRYWQARKLVALYRRWDDQMPRKE
ncbi:MAG TPA: WecB/TagA/CpsF family glycosyltransferase [Opitutales bacterium]|nr:WecB/TagA/CpsF family glycosyltransferase [Opitutales bacterium]